MRRRIVCIIYLLVGAAQFLGSGCSERNPDDSQLPWARPSGWEGGGSFTAAKTR
ncbi:MAG: hypothetical protein LBC42_03600 [Puniceicoccales bacterium]|nr:hypothetical protein [Puniceicoccales bacterium]